MYKLVLLRHGESEWNKVNLFTGWTDVDLSEKGVEEAKMAGEVLAREKYRFDIAYTSLLKRAIRTLYGVLTEMDLLWLPVIKHWRLNERHYGSLQGLNKAQVAEKEGADQVKIWRRSYDIAPPPLPAGDKRAEAGDPRYAGLPPDDIPLTECLRDTVARFIPYWEVVIAPQIAAGKQVIIAAHGNSLRALMKHLDDIDEQEITGLNIPTGIPLVYELDDHLKPIRHYYLGDEEAIRRATETVANQAAQKS